ncbi:hypothetical protein I3843_04G132100, partial [Carya illinoinensis]
VHTLNQYTHRGKVMQFLMGLADSYDPVRVQILLYDPLPPLNRVLSLVQQEEQRRQLNSAPAPLAMLTKGPNPRNNSNPRRDQLFCSHCNIHGHSLELCSHCRIPDHTKEKCYKLHGFPPRHKNTSKFTSSANQSLLVQDTISNSLPITQEQYGQLIALLQSSKNDGAIPAANNARTTSSPMSGTPFSVFSHINNHASRESTPWIIDTGAMDHMICSPNFFTHNVNTISQSIKLPNGASSTATHIGDVHLSNKLILHNVLCVPDFSFNLISARALAHHSNCCLIFFSTSCYIQDHLSWMTIGVGTVHDGLYQLQLKQPNPHALRQLSHILSPASSIHTTTAINFNFSTLWHNRLGHTIFPLKQSTNPSSVTNYQPLQFPSSVVPNKEIFPYHLNLLDPTY